MEETIKNQKRENANKKDNLTDLQKGKGQRPWSWGSGHVSRFRTISGLRVGKRKQLFSCMIRSGSVALTWMGRGVGLDFNVGERGGLGGESRLKELGRRSEVAMPDNESKLQK